MFKVCLITGRTGWQTKTCSFALDSILGHGLTVEDLSGTEDWKRYKTKVKESRKVGPRRRGLLLFSETGNRCKVGQPFHGDQVDKTCFDFTVCKKRNRPATCRWKTKCCLCNSNQVSPVPLNIRRKSSYISEYRLAQSFSRLGHMSVNKLAGVTAHYYCLYYASGEGMLQDFKLKPEDYLEGFPITEILATVEAAKKKKCSYCSELGAASECAYLQCYKEGFYHFPCGLAKNSFQTVNKTFCVRHGGKDDKIVGIKESKKRGRKPGSKNKKCLNVVEKLVDSQESVSSQESCSLLLEEQAIDNPTHVELNAGEQKKNFSSANDQNKLDLVLEPICFLDIVSELESSGDQRESSNGLMTFTINDASILDDESTLDDEQNCETTGGIYSCTVEYNSYSNMEVDVQDTQENNQPTSPLQSQENRTELEILQDQLVHYEVLLEKRKQENEEMEEKHKNDLAYKQGAIDNLEQKLQQEKDAQKVLLDGKKIQINHLKKENIRVSKKFDKLLTENQTLLKKETLELKSKNLQISELKREKAQLVQRMRSLGNLLIEEASKNDLGNEYVEESIPDDHENVNEESENKRELSDMDLDIKDEFVNKRFKF